MNDQQDLINSLFLLTGYMYATVTALERECTTHSLKLGIQHKNSIAWCAEAISNLVYLKKPLPPFPQDEVMQ